MSSSNVRPPELHVSALETMAASYSARTIASVQPSLDAELDAQVWQATLDEVAGGTLDGPFDVSELPAGHVASPRFGIRQGQKVRPIDNLSVSGLNSTVGLPERLQVDTIDEVASVIKGCMQSHGPACSLVGRTYDLKRAYRQLGICEDHCRFSWVAVWLPEHSCAKIFQMRGLPFGGTASVASFLRMSKALKEMGVVGAALAWSSFFDDFICISRPEDSISTDLVVKFLFRSCGWVLSEDPEKDKGFQSAFTALGVVFDLSRTGEGLLTIGNTDKRKTELMEAVASHLAADSLSPESSESLRSRLLFAESQIYGRGAKLALRAIAGPALRGALCKPLTDDARFGLQWMMERVVKAPPREIWSRPSETLLLFVDGACEPAASQASGMLTSIGAVLLDSSGRGLNFFGMRVPEDITLVWANGSRTNLVFEAEVLPYAPALECWGHLMNGARHSWIKGSADSSCPRMMIHRGALREAELQVIPYFCRVPTHSNLADGPSRDDFEQCLHLGAEQTFVDHQMLRRCALVDRLGA